MSDFCGNDGGVKGGAGFGDLEILHKLIVNEVVLGKIIGGGNEANDDGGKLMLVVEVAGLMEDVVDVDDGFGEILKVWFDGLAAAVWIFDVADYRAVLVFEVQ